MHFGAFASNRRQGPRPAHNQPRLPEARATPIRPDLGPQALMRRKCACGGSCPSCQEKDQLKVGPPGDLFEQQADRVADQVMRMPEGEEELQRQPADELEEDEEVIQAKPPSAQMTPLIQRQVEPGEEEEEEPIQAKPLSGQAPSPVQRQALPEAGEDLPGPGHLSASIERASGGQPLPARERAFFEPRFGRDFGQVRIHDGREANRLSRKLQAQAFTRGSDVFFAQGHYAPGTQRGRKLMAHELTHVVQQQASPPLPGFSDGLPEQDHPGAADSFRVPHARLQRQCEGVESAFAGGRIQRKGSEQPAGPAASPEFVKQDEQFGARFHRLRTGCLDPGSVKVIADAPSADNNDKEALGRLKVLFRGQGRTTFVGSTQPSDEKVFARGKFKKAPGGKWCFCDCMHYRQFLRGVAWDQFFGEVSPRPVASTKSGKGRIDLNGQWQQEDVSTILGSNIHQKSCQRETDDHPGIEKFGDPNIRSWLRFNFLLQIWDACQQKQLWGDERTLTITGISTPRKITWTKGWQPLDMVDINQSALESEPL